MNTRRPGTLQLTAAWLFWLLPLAGFPLALFRLTGNKVPLFGMVQMVNFTELGIISLAVILLNFRKLCSLWQNSAVIRLTAISGIVLMLASAIQQFLYGGSSDHLGTALFYAATPLAGAVIAPLLRKTLPAAAAFLAVLLLISGIFSEQFTGLTGNWNWTQILFFAMVPGIFILSKKDGSLKKCLLGTFFFFAAGSCLYPQELSITLAAALPLTAAGMWFWNHFPCRYRKITAITLFVLLLGTIAAVSLWCRASDSRIQLFASTAELLKDHGIIGIGRERFFDFIQEYITPGYFLAPFAAPHHPHPHNEILHLWSAFGIAGVFFAGTLFCGVLNAFPASRRTPVRKLLPFWIFLLIFVCAQSDLTGAIISGAFWMLAAAGTAIAPASFPVPPGKKTNHAIPLISAALLLIALVSAVLNLRATLLLRKGRLAAISGNIPAALEHYQKSIQLKPFKEALYGSAEIALHAAGDHRRTIAFLEQLHSELGFDNFLHSNRMKAVSLVNTGNAPRALDFIRRELRAYPVSIINHRLHIDLLKLLNAPETEVQKATGEYLKVCRLRGISPARGYTVTMTDDDKPLPPTSVEGQQLTYPRLFPGIVNESAAALTFFLAALGIGGACCFRRRQNIMVELALGIAGCAVAGAILPPASLPPLLLIPALFGISGNLERFRRHWKVITVCILPVLFMLPNALLPPNSWDEQVYQIALLKQYADGGFWTMIADNPYSAYPSLIHAFLLCGFTWGGATLPRLIALMIYALTGMFLFCRLSRHTGKFSAGAIVSALMISPLSLLLIRNFYVEIFILLFAIAGSSVLLKEDIPDHRDALIAGMMAGCCAAVKLTGAGAALALLVLLLFCRRGWRMLWCFFAGAALTGSLFYLRTWYFYGNPFYPYGSALFGAPESACLVEKFHHLLGGHYGLNALYGTLFGWLFTALKPKLYDGISCGFQFPLFFLAGLIGAYLAGKQNKGQRRLWFGSATAIVTAYLFWGLTSRQTRFIYPVFFALGITALLAAERLPVIWKRILVTMALIATVISLIIDNRGMIMHYYYSCRVFANARKIPAGFAAAREHGYARLLHRINTLPPDAKIALLAERRTLYMPRPATILLPHFQERLTPLPETPEQLFEELKIFDYLVIRIPASDVDRAPEYDGELNRLYTMLQQLLDAGKLAALPDSEMMILRVVTSAAGDASASKAASSSSRVKAEARFRNEDGNPLPRK